MNPSKAFLWTLLGLTLAGAAVVSALSAGAGSDASPAGGQTPPPGRAREVRYPPDAPQLALLRSTPAEAFPVPLGQPLEARLAYDDDLTARLSLPVSGRVTGLLARPGDAVKAGQALLTLDSPDLGSALADLERARADVQLKRRALARLRELGPGDAVPARDIEQAQADLAQASAESDRTERRLKNLLPSGHPVQGQQFTLRSPLAGIVTERSAGPGMEVAPGQPAPLFVVSDLRRLWALVDIPESLAARVHAGDRLVLEGDEPVGRREARVAQVGRVVDPNTRRAVLRATVDNADGRLMPEMFMRAWLQGATLARAVRVPTQAIVPRGVYSHVFVETEPGRFERRRVEIVARGGAYSFIGEGLTAGDRVVVSGALLLDAELGAASGSRP